MTGISWKLSYGFQLEEEGRWDGLFHTRVVVQERSCAMTIDHMSLINAASIEMVEKLNLPMTPHPQPYLFRWGHEELIVTQQTKVPFLLGNYFCEVLCDVIPAPIISCHLLLGKPWYKEHDVAYDCQTHIYAVKKGKKYDLVPMGEELFISWRKEHLEKIKEQKEEEKKKVEVAKILTVVVQSAKKNTIEEIDSKPRTVLFQGGEDDTTACNLIMMTVDDTTSTPSTEYATDVFQDVDGLVGATTKHDMVVQTMCKKKGDMFLYSPKSGHEGARMHGSGSSQKSISRHQVVYYVGMQEFVSDSKRINQVCYFFGRLRPPEQVACIKKFAMWDRLCLMESGWGPPAVKQIHGRWCLLPRCKRQLIIKYSRVQNRLKCQFPFELCVACIDRICFYVRVKLISWVRSAISTRGCGHVKEVIFYE